jgi:hypothetical protein
LQKGCRETYHQPVVALDPQTEQLKVDHNPTMQQREKRSTTFQEKELRDEHPWESQKLTLIVYVPFRAFMAASAISL